MDHNYFQTLSVSVKRPDGLTDAEWQEWCRPAPEVKQPVPNAQPGDQSEFLILLDRWGIPYELNGSTVKIERKDHVPGADESVVQGYDGFYANWEFDEDGRFIETSIWE